MVLPLEGAPLVYSTAFAHDIILHVNGPGAGTDIPITPDAFQGGLVVSKLPTRKLLPESNDSAADTAKVAATANSAATPAAEPGTNAVTGTISGFWGFDTFKGPTVQLQDTPGKDWKLAASDLLIAGHENHLFLSATGTACIDTITIDTAAGKQITTQWRHAANPGAVDVTVSLKTIDPGSLHLAVHQYGESKPDTVAAEDLLRACGPERALPSCRRYHGGPDGQQPRPGPSAGHQRPCLYASYSWNSGQPGCGDTRSCKPGYEPAADAAGKRSGSEPPGGRQADGPLHAEGRADSDASRCRRTTTALRHHPQQER